MDYSRVKKFTEQMLTFAKDKYHKLLDKQETAAKKWFKEQGKEYLDEDNRRNLPDEETSKTCWA